MFFSNILKKSLISLFFLLASYQVSAQNHQQNPPDEYTKFINKGLSEYNKGEYGNALELFIKAEVIAEKTQDNKRLLQVRNNIGLMYANFSNSGEALDYYLKALDAAEKVSGLEENKIRLLSNIGVIHGQEKDLATALGYYKEAYQRARKINSNYDIVLTGINISDVYNKLGRYNEALELIKELEKIADSDRFRQSLKMNQAETLMLMGNLNAAQKILESLNGKIDQLKNIDVYIYYTQLISTLYEKQGKIDLAIGFARKGLDLSPNLQSKIDLYNQLGNLHYRSGEYNAFKNYTDSLIAVKDSVSIIVKKGLYESSKVKLKVEEYQNQVKATGEKQKTERIFFIIGIVVATLIFYMIYRGLKHRIAKQKQEKINADNEKKIYELQLDSLKNNIAEKNRKLSAKALYLSGRNELIDDVITSLSAIPEVSNKKEVSDYIRTLKAYIKTDEEWDDFIAYFEQVNPEFIKTLANKFPDLNTADIRFLCYVYMNLDVKEIGNIYNITYNAAVKRLRRIREKMQIDKDISLHEYLVSLR